MSYNVYPRNRSGVNAVTAAAGVTLGQLTAALANYLPLSGGTLTGALTIMGTLVASAQSFTNLTITGLMSGANATFTGLMTLAGLTVNGLTTLDGNVSQTAGSFSTTKNQIDNGSTGAATFASTLSITGAITGASYTGGPISGTTGGFSGAITGASYTGGPISGTTGTFSSTLGAGASTLASAVITGSASIGSTLTCTSTMTGNGSVQAGGAVASFTTTPSVLLGSLSSIPIIMGSSAGALAGLELASTNLTTTSGTGVVRNTLDGGTGQMIVIGGITSTAVANTFGASTIGAITNSAANTFGATTLATASVSGTLSAGSSTLATAVISGSGSVGTTLSVGSLFSANGGAAVTGTMSAGATTLASAVISGSSSVGTTQSVGTLVTPILQIGNGGVTNYTNLTSLAATPNQIVNIPNAPSGATLATTAQLTGVTPSFTTVTVTGAGTSALTVTNGASFGSISSPGTNTLGPTNIGTITSTAGGNTLGSTTFNGLVTCSNGLTSTAGATNLGTITNSASGNTFGSSTFNGTALFNGQVQAAETITAAAQFITSTSNITAPNTGNLYLADSGSAGFIQAQSALGASVQPLHLNANGGAVQTQNVTLDNGTGGAAFSSTLTTTQDACTFYAPLAASNANDIQVGLNGSTNNSARLQFNLSSSGSATNSASLSVQNGPALSINGNGALSTTHTTFDNGSGAMTVGSTLQIGGTSGTTLTSGGNVSITGPASAGTLALTSQIPSLSGLPTLSGTNTFTAANTFSSGIFNGTATGPATGNAVTVGTSSSIPAIVASQTAALSQLSVFSTNLQVIGTAQPNITMQNGGNNVTTTLIPTSTANRSISFPDATGTVQLAGAAVAAGSNAISGGAISGTTGTFTGAVGTTGLTNTGTLTNTGNLLLGSSNVTTLQKTSSAAVTINFPAVACTLAIGDYGYATTTGGPASPTLTNIAVLGSSVTIGSGVINATTSGTYEVTWTLVGTVAAAGAGVATLTFNTSNGNTAFGQTTCTVPNATVSSQALTAVISVVYLVTTGAGTGTATPSTSGFTSLSNGIFSVKRIF